MVYKRFLRISWTKHITNEEIYQKTGETRSFLKTLKTRRAMLIGHMLRHDSLLSRIIEGALRGRSEEYGRHWTTLVK